MGLHSPTLVRGLDSCCMLVVETQALSTLGKRVEGRGAVPISTQASFQSSLGVSVPAPTDVWLCPPFQVLLGMAGQGKDCAHLHLHCREQRYIGAYLVPYLPLISPPVLSNLYLFPSPERSQEQGSNWDKGELQMKAIRPSPSGVPLSGFLLLL